MKPEISDLLPGEWNYRTANNNKIYIFMEGITDVFVYSDYEYPKAEKALYKLEKVDGKNRLEIKHPVNTKLKDELYEIKIEGENMYWSYVDESDKEKIIRLVKFSGERKSTRNEKDL
jgi:hypothetical protein